MESRISFFFFHRGKVIESRISFLLEDIRIDEKIEYPFFFFIADIKIEGENLFFITVR